MKTTEKIKPLQPQKPLQPDWMTPKVETDTRPQTTADCKRALILAKIAIGEKRLAVIDSLLAVLNVEIELREQLNTLAI